MNGKYTVSSCRKMVRNRMGDDVSKERGKGLILMKMMRCRWAVVSKRGRL